MLWECDWKIFKESVFENLILENVKTSMWLDVATLLDATSRVLKQTQIIVFNFAFWSFRVIINLLFARHFTLVINFFRVSVNDTFINCSKRVLNLFVVTKKRFTIDFDVFIHVSNVYKNMNIKIKLFQNVN